jgi:hypothetical protein
VLGESSRAEELERNERFKGLTGHGEPNDFDPYERRRIIHYQTPRLRPGHVSSFAWCGKSSRLSHLFRRRDSVTDAVVECLLEAAPGAGERRACGDGGGQGGIELGERRCDDARVHLGEEDGEAAAFAGELVAV